MDNPCKTCTRVERPRDCDNKKCTSWQAWILSEWQKFNNYFERYMKAQVKDDGTEDR